MKLWLIVGDGSKIMAGRGWWQQSYGWSWVEATKLWLILGGRGWSWMVARFSNAL